MTLYAKRLNHGRSEIWVDDGPHRDIATNAVVWAVRTHCSKEEFDTFFTSLHFEMGNIAEVFVGDAIVADLGL